jgi:hypothetical protein
MTVQREGKGREWDLLQVLALNFQRVVFLLFSQPKTGVPVPRVCHMRQARPSIALRTFVAQYTRTSMRASPALILTSANHIFVVSSF